MCSIRPGAGGSWWIHPETLGEGLYSNPELSWDATRILFCFKGDKYGSTNIYEIGIDGTGLRIIANAAQCNLSKGRFVNQHDVGPAYLPDDRVVFTSTRPNGLVPCNNTGVDIMHVMGNDGADILVHLSRAFRAQSNSGVL